MKINWLERIGLWSGGGKYYDLLQAFKMICLFDHVHDLL